MVTANCDVGPGISLYYIADKWLSELLVAHTKLPEASLTDQKHLNKNFPLKSNPTANLKKVKKNIISDP